MQQALRTDQDVQDAVKALIHGCAPERRAEIDAIWSAYRPEFQLTPDVHEGERFILDAGAYRYVRFNHRVLRAFWLAAFIAWEGHRAVHSVLQTGSDPCSADFTRFRLLTDAFRTTLASDDPTLEPLPTGIPEPGKYPGANEPLSQAPAELATLATSWAFLHETRHIRHQQEGTGAPHGGSRPQCHAEEFSCDEFAARFLIEHRSRCAQDQRVDADAVLRKRRNGVAVGMFALSLMTENHWQASDTHPSVQSRMDALRPLLGNNAEDFAMIIGAFMALRCIWPDVPISTFS